MSTSSDYIYISDIDQDYDLEEDANYIKSYVWKHLKVAWLHFQNISDPVLRYIIILWYLIDTISIDKNYVLEMFRYDNKNETRETHKTDEMEDIISSICINNISEKDQKTISSICVRDLKREEQSYNTFTNIKFHLQQQEKLNILLGDYLKCSLTNNFVVRYNECIRYKCLTTSFIIAMRNIFKEEF